MENIIEMLKYAGIPTIITAILGIIQGSRMKKIEERARQNISEADYSDRILKQADERVQQAIDDKNRLIAERDQSLKYAGVQKKSKQEYREKFYAEQEARHALQLELKDAQIKANDERYFRCEVEDCPTRKPPRKRIQIVEKSKKQENGKEERKDDAARIEE